MEPDLELPDYVGYPVEKKPAAMVSAADLTKDHRRGSVEPESQGWTRADLHGALCRSEFVPFFQPKVDLVSGRATCVEMLARWNHPVLGILPPGEFIEVMEQNDLIDHLTEILLHKSLRRIQQCAAKGWKVGLAINFSPLTLQDTNLPAHISDLLAFYRIAPSRITVEVTETAITTKSESVHASLMQMHEQGFKIAIDDFGMGYSSLQLLSQMPFTEIKIDRMFVAGIVNDRKSTIILESIVDLAHRLNMRTVAEGIETRDELDFMQELGCTTGQGFFFSKPVTCRHLIRYLEQSEHTLSCEQLRGRRQRR
jgi:EAL domain-containing protein (putative c-di-GMP-specific phosphodiesterase class I)